MPTLKFAVPETWHEPIAHAPVLSERRRVRKPVAAYHDLPGRDGIAEERGEGKKGGRKLLSSEPACVTLRTRPLYVRSLYRFIRNKFRPI